MTTYEQSMDRRRLLEKTSAVAASGGRREGGRRLTGVFRHAVWLVMVWCASCRPPPVDDGLTFDVRGGPLTISVVQTGTIVPRDREVIKCKVPGTTTILSLVEEGAKVKKGDLLIELDASKLNEERFSKELNVKNAEAAFIRAREDVAIVENESKSATEKAILDLEFAKQDLEKYTAGEFPQEKMEAAAKITIAAEEVERAREQLKWSRILSEEKYISQTELQADELALKKAELDLDVARGSEQLLEKYTYQRTLAKLKSDVVQAEMALERTRRKARANEAQAAADLSAKESEFNRQRGKLDELIQQIADTRMVAPNDGEVIYATSAGSGAPWRQEDPLAEGRTVREREDLIYLPSTDRMMVVIKIHESDLRKIHRDMQARVTISALPGTLLSGRVSRIAPLPDPSSTWMNPDMKVYDTQVDIETDGVALRSGMSCTVEIIVEHYPEALFVPLQCVTRVGHEQVVYVVRDGVRSRRPVAPGLDNGRMVHILSGLESGEQVLLAPPLREAERHAEAELKTPLRGRREASGGSEGVGKTGELNRARGAPAIESERNSE